MQKVDTQKANKKNFSKADLLLKKKTIAKLTPAKLDQIIAGGIKPPPITGGRGL